MSAPVREITSRVDAPLQIAPFSKDDLSAWDDYVLRHPEGSFFHLSGWGEIARAVYGYEPVYLAALRDGVLTGVLPVVDIRAPLFGSSLVSTAFTVGGGPIGDGDDVVAALAETAAALGEERAAKHVELRGQGFSLDGWATVTGKHASFRMNISPDEQDCFNSIPRKRRADLRKALAAEAADDLAVRYENDIDTFYKLYARSLRRHGTPVMPKRFIEELARVFGRRVEISFADVRGEPVAALLSFTFKDCVLPYYIGSVDDARSRHAHDLLYWTTMRRAAAAGVTQFDFGRSQVGSGAYQYKKTWGAAPSPVTHHYRLIRTQTTPNVSPNNVKFKAFSKAWSRLPLPVANTLGPLLAPNFP